MSETPSGRTPPRFTPIPPEEAERRRKLAENAARRHAFWHPSVRPGAAQRAALWKDVNWWVTGGSFALFVAAAAWRYDNLAFGLGLGLVILIHEIGHATGAVLRGLPVVGIVMIPFIGGIATTKRYGNNPVDDAFVGILGPLFGIACGILCYLLFLLTKQPVLESLTGLIFAIHLLNMLPIPPLDGSHVMSLVYPRTPRGKYDPNARGITPALRWRYGLLYGGVALLCAVVTYFCYT